MSATSVLPHWLIAGQLRAAHAFEYGIVYIKPRVDADFQYLSTGALTESGAAGAGLTVQASGQTYFTVQPAIEVGGDVLLGGTPCSDRTTLPCTKMSMLAPTSR